MTKLQGLKKQLLKTGTVCFVIALIFGGMAYFSMSYADGLEKNLNKLNSEIKRIGSDVSTANRDFKGLTEAADIYNNIPDLRRPTINGFSSPQERIRAIVPIIHDIKKRYKLPTLDYTFNGRPKSDNSIPLKYTEGFTNDLSLTFSALTDELALSAIKELSDIMPGYMVLENISISNEIEYSNELINQLKSGETNLKVVTGKANFAWKTLKILDKPRKIEKQKKRRR